MKLKIILTLLLTLGVAGILAFAYPFFARDFGVSLKMFLQFMGIFIAPIYIIGILDIWHKR